MAHAAVVCGGKKTVKGRTPRGSTTWSERIARRPAVRLIRWYLQTLARGQSQGRDRQWVIASGSQSLRTPDPHAGGHRQRPINRAENIADMNRVRRTSQKVSAAFTFLLPRIPIFLVRAGLARETCAEYLRAARPRKSAQNQRDNLHISRLPGRGAMTILRSKFWMPRTG
jgi:hypothetical protein